MKLNLGCGNEIQAGYINIDTVGDTNRPHFQKGDYTNLDWVCADNCIEEIVAFNVLQRVHRSAFADTISNWAKKLISGGVIKIASYNIRQVCVAFACGQMDFMNFEKIIYGDGDVVHKTSAAPNEVIALCEALGLVLESKSYSGYQAFFEVKKP